jgi:hypothetical protein
MNKKKLKSLLVDQIQLALEEHREEILDAVFIEATEVDEDGESVTPDLDLLEEVWEEVLENLF